MPRRKPLTIEIKVGQPLTGSAIGPWNEQLAEEMEAERVKLELAMRSKLCGWSARELREACAIEADRRNGTGYLYRISVHQAYDLQKKAAREWAKELGTSRRHSFAVHKARLEKLYNCAITDGDWATAHTVEKTLLELDRMVYDAGSKSHTIRSRDSVALDQAIAGLTEALAAVDSGSAQVSAGSVAGEEDSGGEFEAISDLDSGLVDLDLPIPDSLAEGDQDSADGRGWTPEELSDNDSTTARENQRGNSASPRLQD